MHALAGFDTVEATGLPAGRVAYTADGGAAHDVLLGSAGDDFLFVGADDDVLQGLAGVDICLDGEVVNCEVG